MQTFSQYVDERSTSQLSGNLGFLLRDPNKFDEIKISFMKLVKSSPFFHIMSRSEQAKVEKEVSSTKDKASFLRVIKKHDLESMLVT